MLLSLGLSGQLHFLSTLLLWTEQLGRLLGTDSWLLDQYYIHINIPRNMDLLPHTLGNKFPIYPRKHICTFGQHRGNVDEWNYSSVQLAYCQSQSHDRHGLLAFSSPLQQVLGQSSIFGSKNDYKQDICPYKSERGKELFGTVPMSSM